MMFALFMVVVLIVTGLIWLLDIAVLRKSRAPGAADPILVEYSKSFFPVILVVFLIRSFIAEPFKIPSESMLPTLLVGDYILVNKFAYGVRLPIFNNTLIKTNSPKTGDVFVFYYPSNPSVNYIKRVIGLPGDKISYIDKQLNINGKSVSLRDGGGYEYKTYGENVALAKKHYEQLSNVNHQLIVHDNEVNFGCHTPPPKPESNLDVLIKNLSKSAIGYQPASADICEKFSRNEEVVVPDGYYLAMGDNRDHSSDSRYWGFVPERNLVGKAFFIWWNFDQFKRIGTSIH